MSYSISNIVYATDLTPRSPVVFKHAVGLARQFQARLHVVTVTTPTSHLPVTEYIAKETWDKVVKKSTDRVRADLEQRIAEFHKANPDLDPQPLIADIHVLEGEASRHILELAGRVTADLIVMGSRGHSALDEVLIGSVAHKVLMKASIPVVLVPIGR